MNTSGYFSLLSAIGRGAPGPFVRHSFASVKCRSLSSAKARERNLRNCRPYDVFAACPLHTSDISGLPELKERF